MKALLLAGGRGTRLLPYTTIIPKPLMPVGTRPILEILLLQLRSMGVTEMILAVGHLAHLLRAYFGDGTRHGVRLSYVEESEPLGTAGPIGLALDSLGPRFLMMNGDLLTTLDFRKLVQFHESQQAAATIGAFQRQVESDFGVLSTDEAGCLVQYEEKPTLHYRVSMGVYVLETASVAPLVRPVRRLDAPDLIRALLADGRKVCCYEDDCFWLDIGRPDDYHMANEIIAQGKLLFPTAHE